MTDREPKPGALDEQQAAIATAGPVFVSACPGAGKTHILSLRHAGTPEGWQRQGRALISFTNRAADEIRARCKRPELLESPHFVGTLDVFLFQYLVRPFLPPDPPPWQRVIDWGLHGAGSTIKVLNRVDLAKFTFDFDPETKQHSVELPNAERELTNAPRPETDYLQAAFALRSKLWRQHHLITGLELRIMALENAGDPEVIAVLRKRFTEIVIDEAQDCTALDISIFARLNEAGLPLVVVADPHQAIYDHQGASPAVLAKLTENIPHHLRLTGNRRCSQRICDLTATMRPGSASTPDLAIGQWKDDATPLLLLPFANLAADKARIEVRTADQAAAVFAQEAAALDPPCASVLCVAWKDADVPRIDTRSGTRKPKEAPAWRLAWAAHAYNDADAHHTRLSDALDATLEILLRYWYPGHVGSCERILSAHGITPAIARRYAALLLSELPEVGDSSAADWIRDARKRIVELPRPGDALPSANFRLNTGTREAASKDRTIAAEARLEPPVGESAAPDAVIRVISTTVHKAKGGEADAVLVAVPAPKSVGQLLEHWGAMSTEDSDVLRLYYVALTRARRLIGLTYPFSVHQQVTEHFDALGMDYRIAPGCEPKAKGSGRKLGTGSAVSGSG